MIATGAYKVRSGRAFEHYLSVKVKAVKRIGNNDRQERVQHAAHRTPHTAHTQNTSHNKWIYEASAFWLCRFHYYAMLACVRACTFQEKYTFSSLSRAFYQNEMCIDSPEVCIQEASAIQPCKFHHYATLAFGLATFSKSWEKRSIRLEIIRGTNLDLPLSCSL